MKRIINFIPQSLLLMLIILSFSCKNENLEKLREENSKLKSEIKEKKTSKIEKYVYAKFLVLIPELKEEKIGFEFYKSVEWKEEIYFTDIVSIDDYNPDSKYIFLDNMEKIVTEKLKIRDMHFEADLIYLEDVEKFEDNKSHIKDRKFFAFNTYREASIDKNSK